MPGQSYLARCGVVCSGDPNIRVCTDAVDPGACGEGNPAELAFDDDSGVDQCPEAEFVCPPSGRVAVNPEFGGRDFCLFDLLLVPPTNPGMETDCMAGRMYEAGCTSMLGTACTGDPTLAVCVTGTASCGQAESFAFNDDSEGRCPRVQFMCPAAGRVVITASRFGSGTGAFTCPYALREVAAP